MDELAKVFKRVSELTSKFPMLEKEEIKELRELTRGLSLECSEMLYDWNK